MMTGKSGKIIIRDDNDDVIGYWTLEDLTPEKWERTERADVIQFLENHLDVKQTDPIQEDITAISNLLRNCLKESTDIVDTLLSWKNMSIDARAERIESIGTLIFFKLTESPVVVRISGHKMTNNDLTTLS